jgi:hypothetical protein
MIPRDELTDAEADENEPTNTIDDDASGSPSTAMNTRDNVLATQELVEAIISFLPMCDILSDVQRVSWIWNAMVQSTAMQTRFWFRSATSEAISPAGFTSDYTWPVSSGISSMTIFLRSDYPVYSTKIAHNPICKDVDVTRVSEYYEQKFGTRDTRPNTTLQHRLLVRRLSPKKLAIQPTWLRTYLTEPPITTTRLEVEIAVYWPLSSPNPSGQEPPRCFYYDIVGVSVHDARGLTFGVALDVLDNICRLFPKTLADEARVVVGFVTEL